MQIPLPNADMLASVLRELKGDLSDAIRQQADEGIKRFAKAMKRAGASQSHGELIEQVCRSLGHKSWHHLHSALGRIDQPEGEQFDELMQSLTPATLCPLPRFERPDKDRVNKLRAMATSLSQQSGLEQQVVLDRVLAYAHEENDFAALVGRSPWLLGPCLEVIEDDEEESFVLEKTPLFEATLRVLTDEGEDRPMSDPAVLALTRGVVAANPSFVPGWIVLAEHLRVSEASSEELREHLAEFGDVLIDLTMDEVEIDEGSGAQRILQHATGYVCSNLARLGYGDEGFELAVSMCVTSRVLTDADLLQAILVCSLHPDVGWRSFSDAGFDEDLVEISEPLGEAEMLLVGLVNLASDDPDLQCRGLEYIMRACFMTDMVYAAALGTDWETFDSLCQVHGHSGHSAHSIREVLTAAKDANPGVVARAAELMDREAVRLLYASLERFLYPVDSTVSDGLSAMERKEEYLSHLVVECKAMAAQLLRESSAAGATLH